ncbi:MAG: hypothetical protein NTZ35_13825 [Ignavibacteriales bacterium]|nr:hypothetical protein [Ignavibacteriales bacterium]
MRHVRSLIESGIPLPLFFIVVFSLVIGNLSAQTVVEIRGEKFYINGEPTYKGRIWNGRQIEGLLFNARMVQGIFDDLNPKTRELWKYPDTGQWDPDRNTDEFVAAMPEWREHGLLGFTLNLQGGSPTGYGNKGWKNSAFDENGDLRQAYFGRLVRILTQADRLRMVVILGIFYFGQDELLANEHAVINAVDQTVDWLFDTGHRNILVEINNECDVPSYDHEILKPSRVDELIRRVKNNQRHGYRFLVGTSFKGKSIPSSNVVRTSDFVLLHGNGVDDPAMIKEMVVQTRHVEGFRPMPVLFNEDDHFDFDKPENNFVAAVNSYASWGFFDYRLKGETDVRQGYQSVPVDWRISSDRKRGFFQLLSQITRGN